MDAFGYFDVLSNGVFRHDLEMGFDPRITDCNWRDKTWKRSNVMEIEVDTVFDSRTCTWTEVSLDVLSIPPTIFLLGVVSSFSNANSNSLFGPSHMSLAKFSQQAAEEITSLLSKSPDWHGHNEADYSQTRTYFPNAPKTAKVLSLLNNAQLDLLWLHKTGQIKSTRQWNQALRARGNIWAQPDFARTSLVNSIQSVFADCVAFFVHVLTDATKPKPKKEELLDTESIIRLAESQSFWNKVNRKKRINRRLKKHSSLSHQLKID